MTVEPASGRRVDHYKDALAANGDTRRFDRLHGFSSSGPSKFTDPHEYGKKWRKLGMGITGSLGFISPIALPLGLKMLMPSWIVGQDYTPWDPTTAIFGPGASSSGILLLTTMVGGAFIGVVGGGFGGNALGKYLDRRAEKVRQKRGY